MRTVRQCALVVGAVAWCWASSVFAPWAESMDPRLWLYDTLFYARFVLLAWGLAEIGFAIAHRRAWRAFIAPSCAAVVAGLAWMYASTDAGLRFRTWASRDALAHSASLPYEAPRHRAGHFLVDTVRMPCEGEAWLWLGRPFGGGTGTGRALVRSKGTAPAHPPGVAHAFRHVVHDWWLAELRSQGVVAASKPSGGVPCMVAP